MPAKAIAPLVADVVEPESVLVPEPPAPESVADEPESLTADAEVIETDAEAPLPARATAMLPEGCMGVTSVSGEGKGMKCRFLREWRKGRQRSKS